MVRDTSFLLASPYDAVVDISGEAQFVGCSFIEEAKDISQSPARNLIPVCNADMKNCTFENVSGKIEVGTIEKCSFTGCGDISCEQLNDSAFTDCENIAVDGGYIRNCSFTHVSYIFSVRSDMDSCKFRKIESGSEDEGAIFIEDCKITHCSFDDVALRNGSYLIEGAGDACVEYCQFTNCRTDRDDLEICHSEIESGKLRKKKIEVDILDDDTCMGLDQIKSLE